MKVDLQKYIILSTLIASMSLTYASDFFDGVDEASKPVMDAARKSIEEVRKGDLTITLTNKQGKPITGTVRARLVRHAFAFGASVGGFAKGNQPTPLAIKVQEAVDELFNTVVVTG